MKYALLVYQSQELLARRHEVAVLEAGRAYGDAMATAGVFVAGAGLEAPHATTTVTAREGHRQVHDGPHLETNDVLAGFGIIDVPDLDAALDWAARHPAARTSTIEVRPLLGSRYLAAAGRPDR